MVFITRCSCREGRGAPCAYGCDEALGSRCPNYDRARPEAQAARCPALSAGAKPRKVDRRNAFHDVLLLEVMRKRLLLHLGRIEDELRDVQRHFPTINATLDCHRDDFTDTVRQNMLTAYEFLDALVDDNLDLFSDEGLEALLQLNHLVLLGSGYDPRAFGRHIALTRQQFFLNFFPYVRPIRRWYRKHETENPYKVASQVYVGVLSQPQLFSRRQSSHRVLNCQRYPLAERLPALRADTAKRASVL
jgi:hypothetical protein